MSGAKTAVRKTSEPMTEASRIEALRQQLGYPLKQRCPQGSGYWLLRSGQDESEAEETCPIAVGFYSELVDRSDDEIKAFLTSAEMQPRICGHYLERQFEDQPVMYLLLPDQEAAGRVAMVLPGEGRQLRKRQIQTFDWNAAEWEARLNRLKQDSLLLTNRLERGVLFSRPLVEWAFYKPIETARELAKELASSAQLIEQVIPKVYKAEDESGYLHKLLKSFQAELLPNLKLEAENEKEYSFADIYAQTVAYALFTARVFSYVRWRKGLEQGETGNEPHFDRASAWQQLPETNPFLRKLFQDISERQPEELGDELIGAIADIFGILRAAKMDAILSDFQQKGNREDIVIRFYEDFLAAYKPQMRERRGVYYTPEPVISYMVRSVDVLLKEKFDKPLGLADPEVMILDPACGTGSFLLWIFQLIHDRFHNEREAIIERVGNISWSEYVRDHLLPRIFGFELLMAPYAIAHLKLSLFLIENGYQFSEEEKLRVYLTNALDIKDEDNLELTGIAQEISKEAREAKEIKCDRPVMVVIGNPPYSGHSANSGIEWINKLVRGKDIRDKKKTSSYFEVDGKPLGERNPKWLNNDYVKFIRFAQWRIDQTGNGIVAFVTDNSYLDSPTFRGMRQSLLETFNNIYIHDLHGNSRRGEGKREEICDENVFDIQQGVGISFLVKKPGEKQSVFQYDFWGKRGVIPEKKASRSNVNFKEKYPWLDTNRIDNTEWKEIKPAPPFYLFTPQKNDFMEEYEEGFKLTEIFPVNSMGITTGDDNQFVSFTRQECEGKFGDLSRATIVKYRAFDDRPLLYDHKLLARARVDFMRHLTVENLALATIRRPRNREVGNFFVSDIPVDKCVISSLDNAQVFALYLYPNLDNSLPQSVAEKLKRVPNLSQGFCQALNSKLGYAPTPETIFYYIYAIVHSPTYRSRYADFLRVDFPRVPLTSDKALFEQLSKLGKELVSLHLMKSPKLNAAPVQFTEQGGDRIVDAGHPKYSNGNVVINKKGDRFANVPENVWNFYVGGYQVCQKWLKDRKGRTLSQEDITHYQRIIVALSETIRLMEEIDRTIPSFPIQ